MRSVLLGFLFLLSAAGGAGAVDGLFNPQWLEAADSFGAGRGAVAARFPEVAGGAAAPPTAVVVDSRTAAALTDSELFDHLAECAVIYSGEKHDEPLHHLIQAAVLEGLHRRRPGVVLGLEMLDAGQQPVLDRYLRGEMPEADFAAFWKEAWGFDFSIYRPLLEYARRSGIPVRALNVPRKIVVQVARGGLASLAPEQRAALPATIHPIRDARYLAYVRRALESHGPMPPERIARMLEAQTVWNEGMAEEAQKAFRESGGPVLVAAGTGHMIFGAGIAESLAYRTRACQRVVLPYPQEGPSGALRELLAELRRPGSEARSRGDYFWLLPASAP